MNRVLTILLLSIFTLSYSIAQDKIDEIDIDFQAGRWLVAADKSDEHVNTTGKENPQAWYQRGVIYDELAKTTDAGFTMEVSHAEAAKKSANSLTMAKSLIDKSHALFPYINRKIDEGWRRNYKMGVKNYNAENYFDAYNYFKKATIYKPSDVATRKNTAASASKAMKYDFAVQEFEKLAEENHLSTNGYKSLIYAAKQSKKIDDKVLLGYYDRALDAHPANSYFRQKKSKLLVDLGMETKAIQELEKSIEEFPKESNYYFQLADLYATLTEYYDEGDKTGKKIDYFKKAEKWYQQAFKIDDENFIGNYNYAVMMLSRAQDFYKKYNSKGGEARAKDKAQRLLGEGNEFLKKGLPYIEKARMLKPTDANVKETLAIFYDRLGKHSL